MRVPVVVVKTGVVGVTRNGWIVRSISTVKGNSGCVSVHVSGAQTKGRSASTAAGSPVKQRQTEATGDPALANATLPAPPPAIPSESFSAGDRQDPAPSQDRAQ